ncbi:hypothetical protein JCGZ_04955 [Jatropha curcas]|uniref:Uncharacterized protein n=1 Tax=Jatropha curcas TaxID=180498 RepID=A0A067JKJ9_JATCU|nr:hypothetical protein JCGZ_04955 [Jatropha curcas]
MEVVLDPALGLGSAIIIPAALTLHHCSWILSMPHTCQLRDIRSCARGSGSLGLSSPDFTPSAMRGIWRLGDCGGTSLASPVLWPDSRWRWIGSERG